MLVEYVDEHRDRFGVEPICTVLRESGLQIAPSTYYAAKARPPSARAVRDAALVEDIRTAHKANLGVYGARKIHAELNREGPVGTGALPRYLDLILQSLRAASKAGSDTEISSVERTVVGSSRPASTLRNQYAQHSPVPSAGRP